MFQLVTPCRSWNIARSVDVGSACVDRGQSPLTYLYKHQLNLSQHITLILNILNTATLILGGVRYNRVSATELINI